MKNLIDDLYAIINENHMACNNNYVRMAKESYSEFTTCCIKLDRMGHHVGFTTSINSSGCIRITEFILDGDRLWGNGRWTSLVLLHTLIDEK